jgi:MFS family permease
LTSEGSPANRAVFGGRARRRLLALLVTAFAFNFVDRTIISTIGQAIKADLKISDTQLGLLTGLYFALLYSVLGVPIARVAERVSRVNIVTIAIITWSAFTALCGAAGSFLTLAVFRFGVGVGEAGLTPPAQSLISDYFAPRERTLALSIYNIGGPIGILIGAIAGGWLTQTLSWRLAFVLVGVPGLLVALAMKLLVEEPPRGLSDAGPGDGVAVEMLQPALPAFSLLREWREIGATCATLLGEWPVLCMVIGATLASFGAYGAGAFVPAHFIRSFGLDFTHVGLVYGLIYGFAPAIGTLAGGYLVDRMGRRNAGWYGAIPALGLLIGAPLYILAFTRASWQSTAIAQVLPLLLVAAYLPPTFGVIQNIVAVRRRATAAAIFIFLLNLFALAGGPPLTGLIIDRLAAIGFDHPGGVSIWSSLAALATSHATDFQSVCPGGTAPVGAPEMLDARCKSALALATRHGIMVALSFYFWGGIPFLLASFGLPRVMTFAYVDRGDPE